MQVRFGSCRLDAESRRFFREGLEVHLSPKAFELLKLLIEHCLKAIAKADLLERVWPATFVSDASLARVITEIRDAVGDDAQHSRFVRTVHGFGYAFVGPVTEVRGAADAGVASGARCWLIWGNREVRLDAGETTGPAGNVTVSRRAARRSSWNPVARWRDRARPEAVVDGDNGVVDRRIDDALPDGGKGPARLLMPRGLEGTE